MSPPLRVHHHRIAKVITLHRPEKRNAMNLAMVEAILAELQQTTARVLVFQGEGRHFCAGGDVSDMANADGPAAIASTNRRFGELLHRVASYPGAVLCLCDGAVMGGGLGLACVADVTISTDRAQFGMPEVRLGLPPAQIAPFVARRMGRAAALRLAITGGTLSALDAMELGIVQQLVSPVELPVALDPFLSTMQGCEPQAVAATKGLFATEDPGPLLDEAAYTFARHASGAAARAGFKAFLSKSSPPWAEES